jgi:sugar phosphate permease
MFGGFTPPAAVTRLPADRVAPEYRRLRRQVFAGIFVGYAAYYLVRNTMALAIPDLLAAYPRYSKAMLGTAMTGLAIAYGASKFLMGSVSDRSNPRYFLPLGLLLSAAIILASGTMKWIYSPLALVYFVRYGVVNWIPTYLETAKGFSFRQSSTAWALYESAAIPGTIACGWIADRWGWNGVFVTMVACCVLTMAFTALTLGHATTSESRGA